MLVFDLHNKIGGGGSGVYSSVSVLLFKRPQLSSKSLTGKKIN